MVKLILNSVPPGSVVLDFGCGRAPVLKHLLEPLGYKVENYDPFFHPDVSVLKQKFDFIASVEVFEHLYSPGAEIARLRRMLKPKGHLAAMTCLVVETVDFASWWYRKDPTHVVFFSKKSFEWISDQHSFRICQFFGDRLTLLSL
jgi:cyclopropane fatty-acyl-phospholipid synthase-like methyltransferase